MLSRDFGSFTLSMGNQFSLHEGVPITLAGYTFDAGVSQQIAKSGFRLDVPFGRRWMFGTYAMHSHFLSPAAVDQYFTVGGEIGFRTSIKANAPSKPGGYLKLGVYAGVGHNYTSANVRFGSAWKF
jgi:hypothetical protein